MYIAARNVTEFVHFHRFNSILLYTHIYGPRTAVLRFAVYSTPSSKPGLFSVVLLVSLLLLLTQQCVFEFYCFDHSSHLSIVHSSLHNLVHGIFYQSYQRLLYEAEGEACNTPMAVLHLQNRP